MRFLRSLNEIQPKLGATRCPALVLLCAVLVGCGDQKASDDNKPISKPTNVLPAESRQNAEPDLSATADDQDRFLASAQKAFRDGDLETARRDVRRYMLSNQQDVQAFFLAAQVEAQAGDYATAVEFLDEIPRDHPQAGLPALGQSADWLIQIEKYGEAEERLNAILKAAPKAAVAHRRLAYLLNRQGRRQAASHHVLQLCRLGNVTEDELHTLLDRCAAVYDASADGTEIAKTSVFDDFSPVGVLAEARILFSQGAYTEALQGLEEVAGSGDLSPAAIALYGRLAVEAQDPRAFQRWQELLTAQQLGFADHWVAMGQLSLQGSQLPEAARAFSEALIRNPSDWIAITGLQNALQRMGENSLAKSCEEQRTLVRKSIFLGQGLTRSDAPPAVYQELAEVLEALDRPLEAVMWRAISLSRAGGSRQQMNALNQQRLRLVSSLAGLSDARPPLKDLDFQRWPKPVLPKGHSGLAERPAVNAHVAEAVFPSMVDVAASVALSFQYRNAEEPKLRDVQIYEQFGGGIAVLDFDLDGAPDVYFNQSGVDPKRKSRSHSNQLFRNTTVAYSRVAPDAAEDESYGQGVTAGDWNQDGFPDLVIGNFRANSLLLNNGDGTFRRVEFEGAWLDPTWTASIAMADVTGDHLPDVVEANYINDPAVHAVTQRGENGRFVKFLGPDSYRPCRNRIFVNEANGQVAVRTLDPQSSNGLHSLGLVIANFDQQPGNEIFIANDTDANQLWKRDSDGGFADLAVVLGCAYSTRGDSSASMGIAVSDFDQNGRIDLHVTNFFNESVHLYMQGDSGSFVDLAIRASLYQDSMQALGFGTQALDIDNNGSSDLAVVNGHIDDLQFKGSPHKMLPQLFQGNGASFELCEVGSDYWSRPCIGRGLAKLDWNRDGRVDLIATHHDYPAALLENRTASGYRWLQIQLVGTISERDAIGATVMVETNTARLTDFVTAGDGYACKNESLLTFGLGDSKFVKAVTVIWPTGESQTFDGIDLNKKYLIVEGEGSAFQYAKTSLLPSP